MKTTLFVFELTVCLVTLNTTQFKSQLFADHPAPPVAKTIKHGDLVPGWGNFVDEPNECRVKVLGDSLELTIPGTYRDLWPTEGKVNSPMFLNDASGDFTATVCVLGDIMPQISTNLGEADRPTATFHSGTLLIWKDADNFVRLDRAAMIKRGQEIDFAYLHVFRDGKRITERTMKLAGNDTWLCLRRQGNNVVAFVRQPSQREWKSFPLVTFDSPDAVRVGVAAVNNVPRDFAVKFRNLSIKTD